MDILPLLIKTVLLRPYVFLFLIAFLLSAQRLVGWKNTIWFFAITWVTAFTCEVASTRTGIPFGWYYYTGSTVGQELYLSNVPFMDSLSFTFLLYASYCLALLFLLPTRKPERPGHQRVGIGGILARPLELRYDPKVRTSWPVLWLTAILFAFIDIVIDPVALRGDRWFLGQIYGYPEPGLYFGVPIANFLGWAVVGLIALSGYFLVDRRGQALDAPDDRSATGRVLLGCGLYYGVLLFNLAVTFWIGEPLLGMTGLLMYIPITALALLRLLDRLPAR